MSAGISKIDFSLPDEVRRPEKTTVEIVEVGSTKVARMTAQPGWVWAQLRKFPRRCDRLQLDDGSTRENRAQVQSLFSVTPPGLRISWKLIRSNLDIDTGISEAAPTPDQASTCLVVRFSATRRDWA